VSSPAAWQPDPTGKHDHRWWDGERWTEHVADAGQASVDPLETPLPPPSGEAPAGPADTSSSDLGGSSPGGWAQGASEQGRDPDRGSGLAGDATDGGTAAGSGSTAGTTGGGLAGSGQPPAWETQQPGHQGDQTWQQPGQQQPGQQPGQQSWQGDQQPGQPADQTWQQPGQQQPGREGWQGGQAPAWGQQPAGGGPAWQQGDAAPRGNDGMALAAMIIGILSLLIAWIPFIGILGTIGGIVALVLGFVGRGRIKKSGAGGNGMAITGIATGAVAIVLSVLITGFFFAAGDGFFAEFGSYIECVEETGDEAECQRQLEEGIFERFGQ
jgi:hypothetical protein